MDDPPAIHRPARPGRQQPKSRAESSDDRRSRETDRATAHASFVLRGGNYKVAGLVLFTFIALTLLVPTMSAGPLSEHVVAGGRWGRPENALAVRQAVDLINDYAASPRAPGEVKRPSEE